MFPAQQNIRLRGHHLICLHFFDGEGYDLEFVTNLSKVVERAKSGEEIEICTGADDVCRQCPHLKREKCSYDENSDNEIRKMDRKAIKLLRLSAHGKLKWLEIRDKIPGIIKEWADTYCGACEWRNACRKVLRGSIYGNEATGSRF